jgi:Ca2+:H+ antiporter
VEDEDDEKAVIGFWSAFSWLVGMTLVISVLSEYVVGTIEVNFLISCILFILFI